METKTLTSVFDEHKEDLSVKLADLSLPKDAQKVQEIVSSFLSNLFEGDGIYRQNLTESEDYILQAALHLLQTQQTVTKELVAENHNIPTEQKESEECKKDANFVPVIGAGLGAVAGTFLGTWGAICGAIAGTAISIYCSRKSGTKKTQTTKRLVSKINVNAFINIVSKICASIDGLIDTYRVQVKRIENVYEQREKPSLTNDYSALLEQIANVYNVCETTDGVPGKLKNAVEMLAETLENYDLKIVNGKIVNE